MSRVAVARHWRIPGFDGVRDDVRDAFRYFVGAPGYGPLGRTWDQAGWMGAFAPEMGGFWWHLRSKNPRRWRRAVRRLWTAVAQPYADRDGGR